MSVVPPGEKPISTFTSRCGQLAWPWASEAASSNRKKENGLMTEEFNRYFSSHYAAARARFVAAAAARGAVRYALPIDARGPDGGSLTIDIAWIGAAQPRRILVHSSGLHGVEGFAGSAIQLALLEEDVAIAGDGALIVVHVLNPFGMAWLRRVNENNVDLNRNFARADERDDAAPELYRRLDAVLNPPSPPGGFDLFYLRAAWQVMRHGLKPLRQAIAGGQYAYPKGLFFGGQRLEQGPSRYLAWMREHLGAVEAGSAIDVHTGLGRWRQESLEGTYEVQGGYGKAFEALAHRTRIDTITQEFGTYPSLQVLRALREENRWHHYGRGSIEHRSKARLKEKFAPRSQSWRRFVVQRGLSLARATAARVFSS
jgi:hypothetical protein